MRRYKSPMTKRHFETVATLLRLANEREQTIEGFGALKQLAEDFATEFSISNPRFDRNRFMKASGF